MRTPALTALAAGLLLTVAPAAHAAGSLTLESPKGGEITGTTPEFSGTGFTDGVSGVMLVVDGPSAFQDTTEVYGDGTWALTGRQLTPGGYRAQACQQDAGGAQACTPQVAFTVRSGTSGSFTAKPPRGSFRDLLAGKLVVPITCPEECVVAARLTVPAKDGRRMGIPGSRANPVLGQETDADSFPAGSHRLVLAPPTKLMARRLRAALAFPLFPRLVVNVELQADWGDEGSVFTSVTGNVRWPRPAVPPDHTGSILEVDAPDRVAAAARSVRFGVRLGPGRSPVSAGVRAAGATVDSKAFQFLTPTGRTASPAALSRGGRFVVVVTWDEESARDASGITPIVAEAWVRRGKNRAAQRFTLG